MMNFGDDKLFYIGGMVRDELLGRESFDIDITYVGNAIAYAKSLPCRIIQVNEKFGTVKIEVDGREIDLASTRDESYPRKGHLPIVTDIGCSLEQDVRRRDFTINTLAKSVKTGEIVDYLGGVDDINARYIRVLHDNSFIDDPTRIIRGLKFSVRFGFELDEYTEKLQSEYLEDVNYDMSYKRLKKELEETFNLNLQVAYDKFVGAGMYRLLSDKSFLTTEYNIQSLVEKYPIEYIWLVYLGGFDLSRLPLTRVEQNILDDFIRIKDMSPKTDFEIYKMFDGLAKETILLYATLIDNQMALYYLENLSQIKIETTGDDIKRFGIKPSEKYKLCLDYILEAKIKDQSVDEEELIKKFFNIV